VSYLTFNNGSAPATPASGKSAVFCDSTGRLAKIDDKGAIAFVGDADLNNYLQNSGFWFAQRQTPGTNTAYSSTAGRAMSANRWGITNENASVNFQRVDTGGAPETGLQGKYYGNFTKITSAGKIVVTQVVEARDAQSLRGRTVRFQLWMKADSARTVRLGLVQLQSAAADDTIPATYISAFGGTGTDPTLGTNLAYIAPKAGVTPDNCTVNGNACDCSVTTAWQRFGAVFDVPSTCKNVIVSVWSNAQVTAASGIISLAQASLTDGYEVQDWAPLDVAEELRNCQRFYCKTFPIDTAPAQNGGTTDSVRCILGFAGATALAAVLHWRYPVVMRAAPTTVVTYNPGAANAQVRQTSGTAADLTATATQNVGATSLDVTATGAAGGLVGNQASVHISADAEI
jgi:hypothetical protein